jgi:hypothetical protein
LTNEHVITKEMIDTKQKITIIYDAQNKYKEIILNKDERFIKEYKNINIDITIIEILKDDNIKEKYFLLPAIENNDLIDKNIYIVQFPYGDLSYSKGKILKRNLYEIAYDVSTKEGSSGSPIFLENSNSVIGIHKQGSKKNMENYGDLIYPIIIDLKPQINYENGDYYKGDIINGKANGKGILYYKEGKIKYEGNFINDKMEGYGKFYYKNGRYYIGQFKQNLLNGNGKLYDINGNIKYKGNFINNKFEGDGIYYSEGCDYYIGPHKNGLRNGKGTLYYENGKIKYEGDLECGMYNGKGTLYRSDGIIEYSGKFKRGEPDDCIIF